MYFDGDGYFGLVWFFNEKFGFMFRDKVEFGKREVIVSVIVFGE